MEKSDYVICSWCAADFTPNFEYNYLYNVTHNMAVSEAKIYSDEQTLCRHKDLICEEFDRYIGTSKFADICEEVMNKFQRFEVWKVNPNIPKEAYSDFDFNPVMFCVRWCERVA